MIPNIIHFIFGLEKHFGEKPFSLFQYIAIKSAIEINRPERVYFYYKYEPTGSWWKKVVDESLVTPVEISVPVKIFGNKLCHYAHKSDVIRLGLLIKYGGIYLDIDTICVRPLSVFFNQEAVMAVEKSNKEEFGLCNAVIMSEPNSLFMRLWLHSYRTFRSKGKDDFWSEHSVKIPLQIAKTFPDTIHIEPETSFFYPSYTPPDLKMLFEDVIDLPDAYVIHLWETVSYHKYLSRLTRDDVKQRASTYNLLARKYL